MHAFTHILQRRSTWRHRNTALWRMVAFSKHWILTVQNLMENKLSFWKQLFTIILYCPKKWVFNLVKLQSLVAKCCKIRKLYTRSCEVGNFCVLKYYARSKRCPVRENVIQFFRYNFTKLKLLYNNYHLLFQIVLKFSLYKVKDLYTR